MHLGKSNPRFNYGINGVQLPNPALIKDLGVFMDSSLSFSSHVASICAKARSRCAVYFKSFISRDLFTMRLFYITYVRPILEYGSTVWNPIAQRDIKSLENVQKYFTNRIPGCVFLPYKQRLSILSLDSLQKRRSVADLVCFYSIMSGSFNSFLSPHVIIDPPSVTRGHNLRIATPILNFAISKRN